MTTSYTLSDVAKLRMQRNGLGYQVVPHIIQIPPQISDKIGRNKTLTVHLEYVGGMEAHYIPLKRTNTTDGPTFLRPIGAMPYKIIASENEIKDVLSLPESAGLIEQMKGSSGEDTLYEISACGKTSTDVKVEFQAPKKLTSEQELYLKCTEENITGGVNELKVNMTMERPRASLAQKTFKSYIIPEKYESEELDNSGKNVVKHNPLFKLISQDKQGFIRKYNDNTSLEHPMYDKTKFYGVVESGYKAFKKDVMERHLQVVETNRHYLEFLVFARILSHAKSDSLGDTVKVPYTLTLTVKTGGEAETESFSEAEESAEEQTDSEYDDDTVYDADTVDNATEAENEEDTKTEASELQREADEDTESNVEYA